MSMIPPTEPSSSFPQAPIGIHVAVCDKIIYLGAHIKEWKGEAKTREQVFFSFQIPALRTTWKNKEDVELEGPITAITTLTYSLGEKSNLRKYIKAWRGVTDADIDKGYDISSLIGKACQISVEHFDDGNAFITGIMGLPDGMPHPEVEGDTVLYSMDNTSQWDTSRVDGRPHIGKKMKAKVHKGGASPEGWTPDGEAPAMAGPQSREPESDDDIPF